MWCIYHPIPKAQKWAWWKNWLIKSHRNSWIWINMLRNSCWLGPPKPRSSSFSNLQTESNEPNNCLHSETIKLEKENYQNANYLLKQMSNSTCLQVDFQTLIPWVSTYFWIFIHENFDTWFLSKDENLKWESICHSVLRFQMLSSINVALYIVLF